MSRLRGPWALVLVLGITCLAWVVARSGLLTPKRELSPEALQALETRGVLLGDPDAPVHVVLLSDYQCAACAALELEVWDSLEVLADREVASVRVIHTPFAAHRRARRAAELHVCAEGTGAGWMVHERLFETRLEWAQGLPPDSVFHEIGGGSGLDSARVARCLSVESGRVEPPDFLDSVGVRALPTVLVNGSMLRPTAPVLLEEISRRTNGRRTDPRASEQIKGCRAVAPVHLGVRRRAEAICREVLKQMERRLAITPSLPVFVIAGPDSAWAWPVFADNRNVVNVLSLDSLPRFMDNGLLHHELAHGVFWEGLEEAFDSVAWAVYGTLLPDVLDEGMAILSEPPSVRAARRAGLPEIDLASLSATFAADHPEAGQELFFGSVGSRRTVLSPCRGWCGRPRQDEWMVISERWMANPNRSDGYLVDTTFWSHPPPEPEMDPLSRFYVVAEAVIAFLEEQFADPVRLRDYVFALVDPSQEGADAMDELARRLGVSEAVVESRWSEWVRSAKEAAG